MDTSEQIIRSTIDKAVSVGGELMRRGVLSILEHEIAKTSDPEVLKLLRSIGERVLEIKV
jgi:hypothetical protein